MKRVIDKHKFYSVERVLFPENKIADSKCDLIRYMRFERERADFSGSIDDVAYTYCTDLNISVEEIMSSFSKTIKYEIRRSEKDDINISFYNAEDLKNHEEVLDDFKATYMHFC